ncbi:MAG: methylmalonyl-CoA epimerase [Dethiobacter sp.]|jgi:methylmalonyl-CoA epimerase|nr:MAG: methylmalonyl-CoA epimerase [Dethiobacter sp.]
MFKKIDHIGIAVKNLEEALQFYEEILGLKSTKIEIVEDQKIKVALLPLGESKLELIQAIDPDSPIAKFIEVRGEGIQHIALRVNNIEKKLKSLDEKGVRLIDRVPRYGAGGARIAFLHPKSTFNVLLELCEKEE